MIWIMINDNYLKHPIFSADILHLHISTAHGIFIVYDDFDEPFHDDPICTTVLRFAQVVIP